MVLPLFHTSEKLTYACILPIRTVADLIIADGYAPTHRSRQGIPEANIKSSWSWGCFEHIPA